MALARSKGKSILKNSLRSIIQGKSLKKINNENLEFLSSGIKSTIKSNDKFIKSPKKTKKRIVTIEDQLINNVLEK